MNYRGLTSLVSADSNKYFNNDQDMPSFALAFVEILCTSGLEKGRKLNGHKKPSLYEIARV